MLTVNQPLKIGGNSVQKVVEPTAIPEYIQQGNIEGILSKFKESDVELETPPGTTEKTPNTPPTITAPPAQPAKEIDDLIKKYSQADPGDSDGDDPVEPTNPVDAKKEELPQGGSSNDDPAPAEMSEYVADYAQLLLDKGFITEAPEGFDTDNLTVESLWELVDFNVKKKEETKFVLGRESAVREISDSLSPTVLDIVNHQLTNKNMTEAEMFEYLDQVLFKQQVSALKVDDMYDAEVIIRQYLSATGDFTADEIDDHVETVKAANALEKEATKFKPKLEAKIKEKENLDKKRLEQIKQQDQAIQASFLGKIDETLRGGKIGDIEITEAERNLLYGIFSNDSVQVPIKGGKKAEMTYFDYLTYKHRYTDKADINRLLLATLILEGKDDVVKRMAEPVKKKQIEDFIKDKKLNFKTSSTPDNALNRPAQGSKNNLVRRLFNQ